MFINSGFGGVQECTPTQPSAGSNSLKDTPCPGCSEGVCLRLWRGPSAWGCLHRVWTRDSSLEDLVLCTSDPGLMTTPIVILKSPKLLAVSCLQSTVQRVFVGGVIVNRIKQ